MRKNNSRGILLFGQDTRRQHLPALVALMFSCVSGAWSSAVHASTYLQLLSKDAPASSAEFSIDMHSGGSPLTAEINRIDQSEPGVVRIFVDRNDGIFSVGSSARLFTKVENLTLPEYRVELLVKFGDGANQSQDYQLVDSERIAYTSDPQVIPENPTTLDAIRIRLPALVGCGEVKSVHTYGSEDYDTSITPVIIQDTYVHNITLEYDRWPCAGSGAGTDDPVEIVLDSIYDGPMKPGLHRVVLDYGLLYEDNGMIYSAFSEGEVARFEVRDALPSRIAGTWYDTDHPGQGLTFQTQSSGELVVGWYTFDSEGAPAWILAQGSSSGKQATLKGLLLSGGVFPSIATSTATATPWGDLHLDFLDCNHATLQWTSTAPGFANGSMDLVRNSSQEDAECGLTPEATSVGRWRVVERGANDETRR